MIKTDNGLMPLGDILNQAIPKPQRSKFEAAGKALKPLSRVQNRLLEPCPEHQSNICFQHSILCQTGLPYRDPSPKVRLWERRQGNVRLRIFVRGRRREVSFTDICEMERVVLLDAKRLGGGSRNDALD